MILDFYSLATFMLPCILFFAVGRKRLNEMSHRTAYLVWASIFAFYCFIAIVQVAGIGSVWDFIAYGRLYPYVNFKPFDSEGYMTYVLNVIMFMPLGFLLPFIWTGYRKLSKVALAGLGMSILIELLQLFSLRATDIDDLTMNTLGSVIGFLIWAAADKLFFHGRSGVDGITKNDAALVILLGTVSTFLLYNWRIFY